MRVLGQSVIEVPNHHSAASWVRAFNELNLRWAELKGLLATADTEVFGRLTEGIDGPGPATYEVLGYRLELRARMVRAVGPIAMLEVELLPQQQVGCAEAIGRWYLDERSCIRSAPVESTETWMGNIGYETKASHVLGMFMSTVFQAGLLKPKVIPPDLEQMFG